MKRFVFILLIILIGKYSAYSDTIKMMQYNLLYYTTSAPSGCNATEAYLDSKDENYKLIMRYENPDVLCVNEIGSQSTYIDRFLNNVLNTDGIEYYEHCPLTNFSGGSIANMLYYNKNKLGYHSHFYVTTTNRDINGYRMYYKSPSLQQGDTVFITFLIAHLKAGGYDNNIEERYQQVQRLMQKLENIGIADNYIFSGDFNLSDASEESYQYLIHYPNSMYKFYDPLNMEVSWHDNSQYSFLHTQSTHTYSENGCYSTGGMDDRFDFILVSPYLYYGSKRVQAIRESYRAVGQDGDRFNGSMISPTYNDAVPENIATALYNASDHLPVRLDLKIDAEVGISENSDDFLVSIRNPIVEQLEIRLRSKRATELRFEIYSIDGRLLEVFSQRVNEGDETIVRNFDHSRSLYLMKIIEGTRCVTIKKIIR